ncbi:MAG: hypothetical protein M1396_00990, partial [Chloroflexi bacterium]|nr:hypothetical protein [Chloroflexota bacterium]
MGSRGRGSLSPASTSRFLLLVPALLSGAGLAAAPFIWLGPNASLGGDDTRLYFVYPLQWLEHFALPSFGSLSGSAAYSPQMHFVPFTLLLAGVAQVLPQINLEAFSFGIALMSGFTGTYVTALLLMPSHLNYLHRIMAAALGGLVYVSAPLIATMYWTDPLSWVMAVGGAPALIAASVAYIKYGHLRWLL